MSWKKIAVMLPLVVQGGCGLFGGGGSKPSSLNSQSFYYPGPPTAVGVEDRRQAADKSGLIAPPATEVPPPARIPAVQSAAPATPIRQPAPSTPTTLEGVSIDTTIPSNAVSKGQYLTYGAVVVTVSGAPIYADKVLRALTPVLSTEAKQREFQSYTAKAKSEIDQQVNVMIQNELWYAAAMQGLSKDEQAMAERAAEEWRKRQITEAGGSLELARRKAAADGMEFDEKVNEQYRGYLVYLFRQKKLEPQVQVTAEEMRQYYEQHLKTEFTDFDQAQFRIIKIDPAKTGGRDQALEKIKDLHDKAAHMNDEEFVKLASSTNDDPSLMRGGGRVGGGDGWVQRGSFAFKPVEDAVWSLQPGQVTDVIEVGNAFYIARLENRKLGRTRPFEDEDVQNEIKEALKRPQLAARQRQMVEKLLKNAVISPEQPNTDPVLEMAMQKYPEWAAKK